VFGRFGPDSFNTAPSGARLPTGSRGRREASADETGSGDDDLPATAFPERRGGVPRPGCGPVTGQRGRQHTTTGVDQTFSPLSGLPQPHERSVATKTGQWLEVRDL